MQIHRKAEQAGASFILDGLNARSSLAIRQADVGDTGGLRASIARSTQDVASLQKTEPAGSIVTAFGDSILAYGVGAAALVDNDPATALRLGRETIKSMVAAVPRGPTDEFYRNAGIFYVSDIVGQAQYRLGDFAAAERTLRDGLNARTHWPTANNGDRREQAEVSSWLAMAIARQGRLAEAAGVIAPVVKLHRALAARNHDDASQRVELAIALYAQALSDKPRRAALLNEAAALIARAPPEMRELHSVRWWRDLIRQEQRARAAAVADAATDRGAG
jgi:tetratricopeptide (TPR) repeat protein